MKQYNKSSVIYEHNIGHDNSELSIKSCSAYKAGTNVNEDETLSVCSSECNEQPTQCSNVGFSPVLNIETIFLTDDNDIRFPNNINVQKLTKSQLRKIRNIAELFVDELLQKALEIVERQENGRFENQLNPVYKDLKFSHKPRYGRWPTGQDFRKKNVLPYINSYVSRWKVPHGIRYALQYLRQTYGHNAHVYHGRAIFYIPTYLNQISHANCNVYFRITVNRLLPTSISIYVTYKFEGHCRVFVANNTINWQYYFIYQVIKYKVRYFHGFCIPRPIPNPVIKKQHSTPIKLISSSSCG